MSKYAALENALTPGFAVADQLRDLATRRLCDDDDVLAAGAALTLLATRLNGLSVEFDRAAEVRGVVWPDAQAAPANMPR